MIFMKAKALTISTADIDNHSSSRTLSIVLLLISVLLLSVLSGVLAAFGNVILLIALLGLYGFFFILATPVAWTVWILFWAVFLITGPSAYFIRFSQLQWLTVLVAAALILPVLLHLLRSKTSILSTPISSYLIFPAGFLLLVIFSTIIDQPQFADFVNASRHYFLMWPLMLVFMLGLIPQKMLVQLWKALMIVAVLQLPMALYQYFFVAQKSARLSPWDAVVGTFPGDIAGGGDSAGMVVMLLIAMLTAIALWRERKLHSAWMVLVVLTGLGTLALAEVKALVMLLPVVIGLYYRKELLRRPVESTVVMVGVLLLASGLFLTYEKLHYGDSSMHSFNTTKPTSTFEHVSRALSPDNESKNLGQLGRVTHLINWWDINVKSGDLHHSLFGYGMGATHTSKMGVGELVNRFPYKINITSSIVLLWETGILGHLVFLLILLFGARVSEQAAKNEAIPEIHRIFLRVGTIGLLLLVMILPYKNVHFYSNPTQFLMMFMLGQAAYWSRFIKNNINR